ncbi:MAG: sulfurtransferase [Chloroflexi bacterium]|nr:sulfurtransferase [Chloroflexota bacterium]
MQYAHPEYLVETEWVAQHLKDPAVRIAESDEDYLLYETGHIPGAVKIDWFTVLQDPVRRDFLSQPAFEQLCAAHGIAGDTTVVFYGDKNNWFACYSFWLFQYYGHMNCKIMNGSRAKWEREGRPTTREVPAYPQTTYKAKAPAARLRAFRDDVMKHVGIKGALVDVRSPKEYTGELLHMPGYPQEGAQRGGHIPGAVSIPWAMAVAEDNTFKPAGELKAIYEGKGITPDRDIVAYCRIGERSAHTWFVLTYLLGYPQVRNYDGSWTEWGNLVNAPIEKDYKP